MAKILFIHHSGLIGGAGVSFLNTVKSLSLKHEVIVAIPSDPSDMKIMFEELSEKYNFKLLVYGRRIGAITYYSGGDGVLSPRFMYRALLGVRQYRYWNRLIKEHNPDVVVLNSKILCWMSLVKEIRKRKSICFVRETIKGKPKNLVNRFISSLLDRFSKVVFLSEYDKKRENLKKAESIVVYNHISKDQFDVSLSKNEAEKLLGINGEYRFNILYVGGVSEMKGFDLAVQAVLNMDDDCRLIVAGNDFQSAKKTKDKRVIQYIDKWKKIVREKDNSGKICFVGRKLDMSPCYAACDVLVFPMRDPHQSRPAFEAGLFKKPVVISDFPNIHEFVVDNKNGLWFESDNAQMLENRLRMLKDDVQLCKQLGENNYVNTQQKHMSDICRSKILELIEG